MKNNAAMAARGLRAVDRMGHSTGHTVRLFSQLLPCLTVLSANLFYGEGPGNKLPVAQDPRVSEEQGEDSIMKMN